MQRLMGLVFLAVMVGGCARNVYEIELDPAGDSLERTLTVKLQGQSKSDPPNGSEQEARRIAAEYHAAAPGVGNTHVFSGRFAGRMPNDVGGSGTYTHWDTPLGSAGVYVERFRGNDDATAILKRRQAAADRVVELLVAWLAGELAGDPQWPALRQFLQDDFRRDLHNLSIYTWTVSLTQKAEELTEPLMRVSQYLVERGYFTPQDIPSLHRAIADADRGDYEWLMTWCGGVIIAKLRGAAPRLPESLSTPEKLHQSLVAFLETTDAYAKLIEEWEQKQKTEPAAGKPEGMDVASQLLADLIFSGRGFQLGGDRLSVGLKTGRPVLVTNGQWSEESGKITWRDVPLSQEGLPPLIYAVWDQPDEIGQRARFGAIVLQGELLFEFCIWYRGLSAGERDEWDTLIDGLSPDSDFDQVLNNFRFSHEPADRSKDKVVAAPAVEAILKGLRERK